MFDENQVIKIKWNNNNREWFEGKGYTGYKRYNEFEVMAKDLMPKSKIKIEVICDYCGNKYFTPYNTLFKNHEKINKDACSKCASLKAIDVAKIKYSSNNFEKIRKMCEENNYKLITQETEYTNSSMKIQYICPKHGLQSSTLSNFIQGHKCFLCSYEDKDRYSTNRLTPEFVEQQINSINNNKLLNPNEYSGCNDLNLKIQCSCGEIFTTSYVNYIRGNVNRCPKCVKSASSGELLVEEFLNSHQISYKPQKCFIDCKDIKPLPFDFYLKERNVMIEFDGQGHYYPVFGQESLESTIKHDLIKNEYCKIHNIRLIRIPYWEGHNINQILEKELIQNKL